MRRVEVDEMLGLVKDEFLLEAQPSYAGKKRGGWNREWTVSLLTLAAAAVILAAVGIMNDKSYSFAVKPKELQEEWNETEIKKEIEHEIESVRKLDEDYSVYFQSGKRSVSSDSIRLGLPIQYLYDDSVNMPAFPFDISQYEKIESRVFCDENKRAEITHIRLQNETMGKSLFIEINESGRSAITMLWEGDGVDRLGVMVYGASAGDYMELAFEKGGQSFYLAASGLTMNEMGAVMDALIVDGISSEDFDLRIGKRVWSEEKAITLEEAVREELFGPYVPKTECVGDLHLIEENCSYYRGYVDEEAVSRVLSICYQDEGAEQSIELYFTEGKPLADYQNVIPVEELSIERVEDYCYPSVTGKGRYHQFFIDYGGFYVDVTAITKEETFEEFMSILCQ